MTPRPIDRRAFLALGLGAAAWACGRGKKPTSDGAPGSGAISLIATAQQGLVIGDTRQGILILRGQTPIAPRKVDLRLTPPGGDRSFHVEAELVSVGRGLGGSTKSNTEVDRIFVFRHDFDRAGIWDVNVRFEGGAARTVFQIADGSPSPTVGKKAIASQSPTTADHRGVDPVCTRTPACSMHDVTIADAVARGRPSVLVFATPAYCESRTCGPVVDLVESAKRRYSERASFIHIEEWKSDKLVGKTLAPTFDEWKLETEPWTFFVGSDGVIKDRWLGAAGSDEIARAVGALIQS